MLVPKYAKKKPKKPKNKKLVNYLRLSLSLICSQYGVPTSHLNTHKQTMSAAAAAVMH